jgi:carboxypeptidase Q
MRSHYETADTNTYNIIAEIPGEDPALKDQVVLIGAHLDSWHSSNGATDNADGVAGMMEAIRILKAVGVRPRRTIRIAIWSGEEQGLLGARFHATKLYGPENVAARDKISVYLNDDPGTGATFGFYMENNAAAKAIFDAWLEPLKDLGVMKNVIGPIGSTDHLAFTAFGIPGFTAIKDYVAYDVYSRHSNTDFYERAREKDLKQSAIVMAVFAYHAAMRDGMIPRAPAAGRGGQ